ncbi:MAG: deoxyribodipyrimidine photo-lyase [Pseudanabaena sp. ELA748]
MNAKTGIFRAKFLLESVVDLRKNLRSLGYDLIIRIGNPEEILTTFSKNHFPHTVRD